MAFSTISSPARVPYKHNSKLQIYLAIFVVFWIYTFIITPNRTNWFTENTLTAAFLVLVTATHRKFKFSDLSYTFMFVYILLHVYGAIYTYAENPFGFWLQEKLSLERNHYDRIVHFSFGLMLAYPMRDYFRNWFKWPRWVCSVLPVEITMSFSALYELVEWAVADILYPEEGVAFLGSQGDEWDAQKDMFLAFAGAVIIMTSRFLVRKYIAVAPSKAERAAQKEAA